MGITVIQIIIEPLFQITANIWQMVQEIMVQYRMNTGAPKELTMDARVEEELEEVCLFFVILTKRDFMNIVITFKIFYNKH